MVSLGRTENGSIIRSLTYPACGPQETFFAFIAPPWKEMEVFPKHNSIPYFQSSVSHSQGYISESLNDSFEASPTKLKVVGKCPPLLSRFGVHCAMFSKTPTRLQELPISNSLYFLDPHLGQRIKSYKIDDWAFHVNVFICVSHLTLVSGVYQSSYPS